MLLAVFWLGGVSVMSFQVYLSSPPYLLAFNWRKYDVGNHELLAIKLALEKWRNWLEGSQPSFLVWADSRNMEFVQSARRLNY